MASENPFFDSLVAKVYRLDFKRPDEHEAYLAAKAVRRLGPAQCQQLRELAELMLQRTYENQLAGVARLLAEHIAQRKAKNGGA